MLDLVQKHICAVVDLDELLAVADTAPLRTAEAVNVQRQLDAKRTDYEKLQKLLMSLYENLTDGIIDKTEYLRLKQSFSQRAADAEKQIDAGSPQSKRIRRIHAGWKTLSSTAT